jgi:hypothetical protein
LRQQTFYLEDKKKGERERERERREEGGGDNAEKGKDNYNRLILERDIQKQKTWLVECLPAMCKVRGLITSSITKQSSPRKYFHSQFQLLLFSFVCTCVGYLQLELVFQTLNS